MQDADAEYLSRVKMELSSHVGSINFVDPANIKKDHKEIKTWMRTEAIHISNKYRIQIETYKVWVWQISSNFRKGFSGNIEWSVKL